MMQYVTRAFNKLAMEMAMVINGPGLTPESLLIYLAESHQNSTLIPYRGLVLTFLFLFQWLFSKYSIWVFVCLLVVVLL